MRLAIIVSHPIQYYSPWFRHLAAAMGCGPTSRKTKRLKDQGTAEQSETGRLDDQRTERSRDQQTDGGLDSIRVTSNPPQNALRVFYLWDFGVTEKTDKGFGKTVKWDVDLLEGYEHEFVPNVSKRPGTDWFGGLDNPELLQRVKAFAPDAVLQFGYNYKSLVSFDLRWDTRRAPLMFRGDSHLLAEDGEQGGQASVVSRQRERIKRWVRELGLRFLFKRFACFLAVGKANADYFRAHGVPESKIVFCPHVVDNEFFRREPEETRGPKDQGLKGLKDPERSGLRAELGIAADELVFLFAGKLEEKKQPMQLLEAFLAADLPKATLLFVGSGGLESKLTSRVASGGWLVKGNGVYEAGTKRVVFLEFQNQSRMPDVYRTGDVLVLPSLGPYETWGLAVNEAACCGLPAIVSSHVGCGPDLIEDGVTGWIFRAGRADELSRALSSASSSRERLQAMGEALERRVRKSYSYQAATAALLGALERVAGKRAFAGG
jgi:glycosyltransferase involved in cell wall biosynthesis